MGFHPWHSTNAAFPVLAPTRVGKGRHGKCVDGDKCPPHILGTENKFALIKAEAITLMDTSMLIY